MWGGGYTPKKPKWRSFILNRWNIKITKVNFWKHVSWNCKENNKLHHPCNSTYAFKLKQIARTGGRSANQVRNMKKLMKWRWWVYKIKILM